MQLTSDHSWLAEVVASGEMNAIEAEKSPQAHAITRWLGADAALPIDLSVLTFRFPRSGTLLLCSDGLWNYAQISEEIAALVAGAEAVNCSALSVSRSLVEFALSKGGHDNITAIVFRVGN